MGLEFIGLLINKEYTNHNRKLNKETTYNSSKLKNEELTPKTKNTMKKIKSEEDFVKYQVPWIL